TGPFCHGRAAERGLTQFGTCTVLSAQPCCVTTDSPSTIVPVSAAATNCLTLLAKDAVLALAPKASVYQSVPPPALRTTSPPKNASRTQPRNGLVGSSNFTCVAVGVAGPFGAMLAQLRVPLRA